MFPPLRVDASGPQLLGDVILRLAEAISRRDARPLQQALALPRRVKSSRFAPAAAMRTRMRRSQKGATS